MVTRTLADLIKDLAERRRLGEPPPVVLLGAGASAGAGLSTMQSLYKFVGVPGFDAFAAYIETRTDNERYRLLSEFLQTQDPLQVTPGYQALATLCENAYFDLVLTTNFDPLLDDALVTAGMRRRDYMLLINGVLRTDRLRWLLASRSPRVKVLKLHGDLFHRFMAWTPAEMEKYLDDVQAVLSPILSTRDFIVVGSSLRDVRIRGLVEQAGGAVWFISPSEVPTEASQLQELRAITGPDLTFEKTFPALADGLGLGAIAPRVAPLAEEAQDGAVNTTDDLIAATVGLAPSPEGPAEITGFLLDAPPVIVTDGYAGNTGRFDPEAITVITSAGRRFTTRARKMLGHPFGPWLLEVPSDLRTSRLRLKRAAISLDETFHVAVAAGERVGLSTGKAVSATEIDAQIEPIGWVKGLVEIRSAVSPGSSGAPVVDAGMNVRGFVVAGSTDPNNPVTYIYPAHEWAAQIGDAPATRRKSARRAPKNG